VRLLRERLDPQWLREVRVDPGPSLEPVHEFTTKGFRGRAGAAAAASSESAVIRKTVDRVSLRSHSEDSMSWRRRVGVAVVASVLTLGVAGTSGAQATSNPAAEDSVRSLEIARGEALMHGDTVALSRMTAAEFNELTRFGTVRPRAANMRDVSSGMLHLLTVRYDSLTVRIYVDVAILQGIADNTGTMGGVAFSGRIRYTRVFVRRDGRWQAVTMQHTPMP
jgi:Domain of unknown function (DUF4440)